MKKPGLIKKISAKIMDFFFGKKFPIFNAQGEIEHTRKEAMKSWKERYEKEASSNWRNHSGMTFKKPQDKP